MEKVYCDERIRKSEPSTSAATLVDSINARLSNNHSGLQFIREHVSAVLSRALGETAPAGQSNKPREVRGGSIGAVQDRLDDISELIEDISDMLARLEVIV